MAGSPSAGGAPGNVVRRNYFNSRNLPQSNGNVDALGVTIVESPGNVIENDIVETAGIGFSDQHSTSGAPSSNLFLGDIAVYPLTGTGFFIQSNCPGLGASCGINGDVFRDDLSIGGTQGFEFYDGIAVIFENDTVVGASAAGFALSPSGNPFTTTFTALDDVTLDSDLGFDNRVRHDHLLLRHLLREQRLLPHLDRRQDRRLPAHRLEPVLEPTFRRAARWPTSGSMAARWARASSTST